MIEKIIGMADKTYLGNSVAAYLVCAGMVVLGLIIIKIVQFVILKRLHKWAEKTATSIDNFILRFVQKIFLPLGYFGIFYISVNTLTLGDFLKKALDITGMAILTIFIARFVTVLIAYFFDIYLKKKGQEEALERSLKGILSIVTLVVWALAMVFFWITWDSTYPLS